jgi:hypothetical protein
MIGKTILRAIEWLTNKPPESDISRLARKFDLDEAAIFRILSADARPEDIPNLIRLEQDLKKITAEKGEITMDDIHRLMARQIGAEDQFDTLYPKQQDPLGTPKKP